MQSKITLMNVGKMFRVCIMTLSLMLFAICAINAQTYVNGTLSSGATSQSGTAAPAGFTWSECQNVTGNTTVANQVAGESAAISLGYSVADDFTVPAGPSWNLTKISVYAYSTGASQATSPFTDLRIRIHNANPAAGATTIVYGDLTTNRLAAATSTGVYRIFNTVVPPTATGTTRLIWKLDANVAVTLAPGTYWLEFETGSALTSNFVPLSAPFGVRTVAGYNAIQNTGTWAQVFDTGITQAGVDAGSPVAVAIPFSIDYSTGACSGTPAPGNTVTSAAAVCPSTSFTLSLQNATSGSGVTYQWQSAPASTGPWTSITGATSSTYSTTISATTWFRANVTCGGNTTASNPVQVTLNPVTACYCTPAFSDCTDGDIITNVTMDVLNNTSTCSASGYTNYTTNTAIPVPSVVIGGANPISVIGGSGAYTESVAVWIDYNQNGVFEASEFTLLGTSATPLKTGNIVVPATALTGITRMRVRDQFSSPWVAGGACATAYIGYGETEDYAVNMVPCTTVTVTGQPANQTAACGNSVTFTATTTGSLPNYQWEYRTSATAIWQNVPNAAPYSGVNTNKLTVNPVTSGMTGYQYRLVFTGACTATDFSSAATLTVTPLIATVSTVPNPAVICSGAGTVVPITITNAASNSVFTATNSTAVAVPDFSQTGVTSNITVSGIPAGATVTNITVTLNMSHTYPGDMIFNLKAPGAGKILNLYKYNGGNATGAASGVPTWGWYGAKITDGGTSFATVATAPFTYNSTPVWKPDVLNTSVVPLGFPFDDPTGYASNATGYLTGATPLIAPGDAINGTWTLAMADGGPGDVGTLSSWTIAITYGAPATGIFSQTSPATPPNTIFTNPGATTAYDGVTPINTVYVKPTVSTVYSVVVTTPSCTSAPLSIPVTVAVRPTGLAVASKTICANNNTSFTVTTTAGSTYTTSWQVSTNGGVTYTTIANGGVYSTATTNTLNLTNVPASYNGYKYRAILASGGCGTLDTSAAATLTVNATPQIVINVGPYTALLPNLTTTLTAAVSPNAGATYTWYRNGVPVAGATGNRLVVGVDALGTYTATVSDVNACGSAVSNAITITDSTSGKLYVYPSPNTGVFQVRYHTAAGNTNLVRGVNIYDDKGAKVYSRQYTQSAPYGRMDVNLPLLSSGAYWAEVVDLNGNRLAVTKFAVQK